MIDEERAETIRQIYRMYLEGYGTTHIAKILTEQNAPLPGKSKKYNRWHATTILCMLKNEKYRGDALLQKSYIEDFLTKKQVKNDGRVDQYYVAGSHPAIIDPLQWDLVQYELQARSCPRSGKLFTQKLICSHCGGYYGSKLWHSTDKYRKKVWQCNDKYNKPHPDKMPFFSDEQIQQAFMSVLSVYYKNAPAIREGIKKAIATLNDSTALEETEEKLADKLHKISEKMNEEISVNAQKSQDQEAYRECFAKLEKSYEDTHAKYQDVRKKIQEQKAKARYLTSYLNHLDHIEINEDGKFNKRLWNIVIKHAIIHPEGQIDFVFKDDTTLSTTLKD